jgi:hypothetical protein
MSHAGHRRGDDFVFGGPVMMQAVEFGPLQWCCWRQSTVTGETEVRVVDRTDFPPGRNPEDAFTDDGGPGSLNPQRCRRPA